ncbi:MAG TPA: helix-turn-helix transcriptional regulator [Nitrososphaera sp.]|jgi:DNA-binding XRE family transcriptional regulator
MQEMIGEFTGSKLRDKRFKSLLTQGELAERIGVSRITVNKWETGNATPSMKHLRSLKRLLKEK